MKTDLNVLAKIYRDAYYSKDVADCDMLLSKNELNENESEHLSDLQKNLLTEYNRMLLHFRLNNSVPDSCIAYRYLKQTVCSLYKQANPALLDWVQPDLDRAVWSKENDKLFAFHKEKIFKVLYDALEKFNYKNYKEWIVNARLLGSLCSYQYNSESDLDSHFIVDIDKFIEAEKGKDSMSAEEAHAELDKVIKYLNREVKPLLDNTKHSIEYYFEIFKDKDGKQVWITHAIPSRDHGEYNLDIKDASPDADRWIKEVPSMSYNFDVELMFPAIIFAVDKIFQDFDGKIGVIKRDIIAIRRLQETITRYKSAESKEVQEKSEYFEDRLQMKLVEINENAKELVAYIEQYKKLKDEEKQSGVTKVGFGEIIFKYLQKYSYIYITSKLKDVMAEENDSIPLERLQEIETAILKPQERR